MSPVSHPSAHVVHVNDLKRVPTRAELHLPLGGVQRQAAGVRLHVHHSLSASSTERWTLRDVTVHHVNISCVSKGQNLQHFGVETDDLGLNGPHSQATGSPGWGRSPSQLREACPSSGPGLSPSFGIYYHCHDMWAANEGAHSISSQLISPHVVWIRFNNIS